MLSFAEAIFDFSEKIKNTISPMLKRLVIPIATAIDILLDMDFVDEMIFISNPLT